MAARDDDDDDDLACGLVLILIPRDMLRFPSFLVGENGVSSTSTPLGR